MGHTGFMLEAYTDMPGFRSEPMIDPDHLKDRVAQMVANGIKVRLHACGDGAVRLGLDAFEYAKSMYGDRDLRHCIEHIEAISPDDIKRFGQSGYSIRTAYHLPSTAFTSILSTR